MASSSPVDETPFPPPGDPSRASPDLPEDDSVTSQRRTSIQFEQPLDPRRPSIQINHPSARDIHAGPQSAGLGPTGSDGFSPIVRKRSLSSPPPPPTFIKRVGFDTFDNKDATDYSLTLGTKHKDYKYTRRSRTFLCGTDQNEHSTTALEWLMDELIEDGDEIVCLRVVEKDSKFSSDSMTQERLYRSEAEKLLTDVISRNEDDKAINIVLEFAVGKIHDTIQRMITIYEPVMLIVGTRGRSLGGIQGLLPGSVSKYCLQHSPVPVIVVRPNSKREKKKKKRRDDPGRRTYQDILDKTTDTSTLSILNNSQAPSVTNSPKLRETSISFAPDPRGTRKESAGSISDDVINAITALSMTPGPTGNNGDVTTNPSSPRTAGNTDIEKTDSG